MDRFGTVEKGNHAFPRYVEYEVHGQMEHVEGSERTLSNAGKFVISKNDIKLHQGRI